MGIEEISKKVVPFLKNHGVEYAGVFGSFAKGQARGDSDIDILVRFTQDISLLDHIGIAQDLEELIGRKVDLVTERSLSKYAAPSVKKDLMVLYGRSQRPDLS